jgi:NAD(P)-dependent dehydrogenase (short-subunit alcohol dehydrogenase family)
MLGVHLDGAFNLSQPAYRVMKAEGYGRFVFIASSAGLFGQPASNLGQVAAADPYTIPTSIVDEVAQVCNRLGIG